MKSDALKHLTKYNFDRKFQDLKYFEIDYFFIFLEFIINLKRFINFM